MIHPESYSRHSHPVKWGSHRTHLLLLVGLGNVWLVTMNFAPNIVIFTDVLPTWIDFMLSSREPRAIIYLVHS